MRYGNDYGMDRAWNRGGMRGNPGRGGGMNRGGFSGRGGGFDGYSRRGFTADQGGFADGFGSGPAYGRPGASRGGRGLDMDRDADDGGREHRRFFGRWANDDEAGTWESDRHGVGRYSADRGTLDRGGTRGRGYGMDYGPNRVRGGTPGGRGTGWGMGNRDRGYDRGW